MFDNGRQAIKAISNVTTTTTKAENEKKKRKERNALSFVSEQHLANLPEYREGLFLPMCIALRIPSSVTGS